MYYDPDVRYKFNRFAMNYVGCAGLMTWVEENECFWLLDVIASYSSTLKKKNADYLKVAEVVLNDKGGCVFTISDEINGLLVKQSIPYTDLKEPVKIWIITENEFEVCMLPSEY